MSNHTPGPWSLQKRKSSFEIIGEFKLSKNSFITCNQWEDGDYGATRSQAEANARLIAAAPELLEALQQLWLNYKSLADSGDAGFWSAEKTEEGVAAMAAIAKATGEQK